jgi:hypothetical protein
MIDVRYIQSSHKNLLSVEPIHVSTMMLGFTHMYQNL